MTTTYPFEQWEQDPQFQRLPIEQKQKAYIGYFERNVADDDFRGLPVEKQSSIKQEFLRQEMKPVSQKEQAPEAMPSMGAIPIGSHGQKIGALETLASIATGIPAQLAGGLAFLGSLPRQSERKMTPQETMQTVQQGLTYEPRTEAGKKMTEAIGAPFKWLEEKAAPAVGEKVADVTGIPELGALSHTAVAGAPWLFPFSPKIINGLKNRLIQTETWKNLPPAQRVFLIEDFETTLKGFKKLDPKLSEVEIYKKYMKGRFMDQAVEKFSRGETSSIFEDVLQKAEEPVKPTPKAQDLRQAQQQAPEPMAKPMEEPVPPPVQETAPLPVPIARKPQLSAPKPLPISVTPEAVPEVPMEQAQLPTTPAKDETRIEDQAMVQGKVPPQPEEVTPPAEKPAPAEAKAKEPWEMMRDEFTGVNAVGQSPYEKRIGTKEDRRWRSEDRAKGENVHRMLVKQALSEGKPVPPEVLKDYPDLKAEAKRPTVEDNIDLAQLGKLDRVAKIRERFPDLSPSDAIRLGKQIEEEYTGTKGVAPEGSKFIEPRKDVLQIGGKPIGPNEARYLKRAAKKAEPPAKKEVPVAPVEEEGVKVSRAGTRKNPNANKAKTYLGFIKAIGGINPRDSQWKGEIRRYIPLSGQNKKGHSINEILAITKEYPQWSQIKTEQDVFDAAQSKSKPSDLVESPEWVEQQVKVEEERLSKLTDDELNAELEGLYGSSEIKGLEGKGALAREDKKGAEEDVAEVGREYGLRPEEEDALIRKAEEEAPWLFEKEPEAPTTEPPPAEEKGIIKERRWFGEAYIAEQDKIRPFHEFKDITPKRLPLFGGATPEKKYQITLVDGTKVTVKEADIRSFPEAERPEGELADEGPDVQTISMFPDIGPGPSEKGFLGWIKDNIRNERGSFSWQKKGDWQDILTKIQQTPRYAEGGLVLIDDFHKQFPEMPKLEFDKMVLDLADDGKIALHQQDLPSAYKKEMVKQMGKDVGEGGKIVDKEYSYHAFNVTPEWRAGEKRVMPIGKKQERIRKE